MNSATSTDVAARPVKSKGPAPKSDAGFRPWHFFLLASLMMATVAVMMSRQATPEHLIVISLTIIAAGVAAAGFYRTFAPLASDDVTRFSEPLSDRGRAAIEREKRLVLRSIKELEFDRAMGKMSPKDFEEMAARLRARAIALMKQLDEGVSSYRDEIERELQVRLKAEATPEVRLKADTTRDRSCACGTSNDADAVFCKKCGTKL